MTVLVLPPLTTERFPVPEALAGQPLAPAGIGISAKSCQRLPLCPHRRPPTGEKATARHSLPPRRSTVSFSDDIF